MYNTILVPLDGSNVAETILPYVRALADNLKTQVELLGVVEPVIAGIHDYVYSKHHISVEDALRKETETYLKKASAYFDGTRGSVSTKIVNGSAAEKIVEEAGANPLTLIAMSTRGRSGVGRWAMGSVTDKVLHTTDKPIFIVRGSEEKPAAASATFRNILIPLDGSTVAEEALITAIQVAKATKLKVTLLRITPPAVSYYQLSEYPAINFSQIAKEVDKDAQQYLENTSQKLNREGLSVETILLHGNAAAAIIDEVKKLPDSMVIMTTHGLSGVKRAILGSVTDRVVTESDKPVLVVTAMG
ncbi:MAG: universal stress protein [Dehalococcoidia bacterium]|nr:universal stress protein [Dehalococcoidia bacterium]